MITIARGGMPWVLGSFAITFILFSFCFLFVGSILVFFSSVSLLSLLVSCLLVVFFRDPAGFKITRQVWMRANCNAEALARILLQKQGVKIEGSVFETLRNKYDVKLKVSEVYVMPSFNDFLGGRSVNEGGYRKKLGSEALIGPVVLSQAVDVDNSELYLLDGTYLGTLNQLRSL